MLPIAEAALTLGITVNALRQRIKRGTVQSIKTQAGWLVATDHRPTTTDHRPTTLDTATMAPLAAMVADLARENRDLAAAAAVWQERARVLEDRLLALSAGESKGEVVGGSVGVRSRWRRWLRALGG